MVSCLRAPDRPNLAFTGKVGDIWYVFIAIGLLTFAGQANDYLPLIAIPVEAFLSWMIVRWIAANLSSNGNQLPIAFKGSALTYIGWNILGILSFITIIGWAWVLTAWIRWICRNISGTRREDRFQCDGTGSAVANLGVRPRLRADHSHSMAAALVHTLERIAIRVG
jgi:hypothetical protein